MSLKEIEKQALKLSISDRKRLIQSLLTSIEKDTQASTSSVTQAELIITDTLDPWTQSLIGVIQLKEEDPQESYIDYLVENFRNFR